MAGGKFLHLADDGTIRHRLGQFVPACVLLGTEVWTIKQFLQAQNLDLLSSCLLDQIHMLAEHSFPDLIERVLGA